MLLSSLAPTRAQEKLTHQRACSKESFLYHDMPLKDKQMHECMDTNKYLYRWMMPGPVSPQMTVFVSLQGGYGADSEMGSVEHS